jgi:hypothetical protein
LAEQGLPCFVVCPFPLEATPQWYKVLPFVNIYSIGSAAEISKFTPMGRPCKGLGERDRA